MFAPSRLRCACAACRGYCSAWPPLCASSIRGSSRDYCRLCVGRPSVALRSAGIGSYFTRAASRNLQCRRLHMARSKLLYAVLGFLCAVVQTQAQCSSAVNHEVGVWEVSNQTASDELLYCPATMYDGWSTNVRSCLLNPGSSFQLTEIFANGRSVVVSKSYKKASFKSTCGAATNFKTLWHRVHAACDQHSNGIVFIGDSLAGQLSQTVACEAGVKRDDWSHWPKISTYHSQSFYLTNSLPCSDKCVDSGWRQANSRQNQACAACPVDGRQQPFSPPTWAHHDRNACALVIGSGAWFSPAKDVTDPVQEYRNMLANIKPLLCNMTRPVVWLGLPPCAPGCNDKWNNKSNGWYNFADFDQEAASTLAQCVTFLNVSAATGARKAVDPAVSSDGLHWCENGHDSVLRFIVKLIFDKLLHVPQKPASF